MLSNFFEYLRKLNLLISCETLSHQIWHKDAHTHFILQFASWNRFVSNFGSGGSSSRSAKVEFFHMCLFAAWRLNRMYELQELNLKWTCTYAYNCKFWRSFCEFQYRTLIFVEYWHFSCVYVYRFRYRETTVLKSHRIWHEAAHTHTHISVRLQATFLNCLLAVPLVTIFYYFSCGQI